MKAGVGWDALREAATGEATGRYETAETTASFGAELKCARL